MNGFASLSRLRFGDTGDESASLLGDEPLEDGDEELESLRPPKKFVLEPEDERDDDDDDDDELRSESSSCSFTGEKVVPCS